MSAEILKGWNEDCVPPEQERFRKQPPAKPLWIARRLEQPGALDRYLFPRFLGLNHCAYPSGPRGKFPAAFDDACKGKPQRLIALATAKHDDPAFWAIAARWCAQIVTFPILPHPHVRPLMSPEDDRLLALMIERRDEAMARWPRRGCERPIQSIIHYGDFKHPERRAFFNGIMLGVFKRREDEREKFLNLIARDRRGADEDFCRWENRDGTPVWLDDGLSPKERARKAAKQLQKINEFRSARDQSSGGVDAARLSRGSITPAERQHERTTDGKEIRR